LASDVDSCRTIEFRSNELPLFVWGLDELQKFVLQGDEFQRFFLNWINFRSLFSELMNFSSFGSNKNYMYFELMSLSSLCFSS